MEPTPSCWVVAEVSYPQNVLIFRAPIAVAALSKPGAKVFIEPDV